MVDIDNLYFTPHCSSSDARIERWQSRRNIDFLQMAREEAHRTVDNQVNTLNEIDDKAARLLRVNLIILGVVLTGLSISIEGSSQSAPIEVSNFINLYSTAGIVLLFGSTIVAGLTLTASHMRAGMSGQNLTDMLWNDYSDKENMEGLIESYGRWIHENYRTNAVNAPLGTFTTLLLIYALTGFGLGIFEAINGSIHIVVLLLTIAILLLITYLAGIVGQISRFLTIRNRAAPTLIRGQDR